MATFNCEACGDRFTRGGLNPRFCSRACFVIGQRKVVPDRTCEYCGIVYTRASVGYDTHYSSSVWSKRRYCGHECSTAAIGMARRNRVTKSCAQCGAQFFVSASRDGEAKFCSHPCASAARNEGRTSANESIRKSAAYRTWRTAVFERDDYTCQLCGERGGALHADHIKAFAFFPASRLDVENGRTLCVPCHLATPNYGRRAFASVAQEA